MTGSAAKQHNKYLLILLSMFGIVPSITQTMTGDLITTLIGIFVAAGAVVDPTKTGAHTGLKG